MAVRKALNSKRASPDVDEECFQPAQSQLRASSGVGALRVLGHGRQARCCRITGDGSRWAWWERTQRRWRNLGVLVQKNLCPAPPVTHRASSSSPWTRLAGTDCLLPARLRVNEIMSPPGFELLWESCCNNRGCYYHRGHQRSLGRGGESSSLQGLGISTCFHVLPLLQASQILE